MAVSVIIEVHCEKNLLVTYELDQFPIRIGARPSNEVVLSDPFVSAEHAILSLSRGGLLLTDQSRNGTFVNGERISSEWLDMGATASIAPFELRMAFRLDVGRREPRNVCEQSRPAHGTIDDATIVSQTFPPQPPSPVPASPHSDSATDEGLHSDVESGASLRVTHAPPRLQGKVFSLGQATVLIGRDSTATVFLDDPGVSRIHACLTRVGDDRWLIKDLQSANGTFVDHEKLSERLLQAGDEFSIGRTIVLRLEYPAPCPGRGGSIDGPLTVSGRRAGLGGSIAIFDLRGRADVTSYRFLSSTLMKAIDADERVILLVLSDLVHVDHAGLGVLVQANSRLSNLGGHLSLAGPSPAIRKALSLSRLDSLFEKSTFDTETEALSRLEKISPRRR